MGKKGMCVRIEISYLRFENSMFVSSSCRLPRWNMRCGSLSLVMGNGIEMVSIRELQVAIAQVLGKAVLIANHFNQWNGIWCQCIVEDELRINDYCLQINSCPFKTEMKQSVFSCKPLKFSSSNIPRFCFHCPL